ncbi:inorganic phosphate transporter, partial [Thermodesulfobacteriota bacterium]
MDLFLFAVIILAGLAVLNLVVGVSNDAVNFLNASLGSRVAPRHIIMIIASLGILAGVTFSSGMIEVARKGIFHPKFFTMPDLLTIFLAVMITNVLLLDMFNTFGLPTSTTVSIVFELLGAAVAVSVIKIYSTGASYSTLVEYINTGKALAIIMGILLSVVLAFLCGAIVQFIARLIFTFDYTKSLKRYGGLWGGFAFSVLTYFILIKGAKGASFLTPEAVSWIKGHTGLILSGNFIIFSVIFQLLTVFTRINILKPIVLMGTFSIAMAFAANDLVNFIGVPLAGMNAYQVASGAANPLTVTMAALQKAIQTNTFLLLLAGAIMVITLWVSKKARTVTRTELSLGRQDEGTERFGASPLSRIIVRMVLAMSGFWRKIIPLSLRSYVARRMDPAAYKAAPSSEGGSSF